MIARLFKKFMRKSAAKYLTITLNEYIIKKTNKGGPKMKQGYTTEFLFKNKIPYAAIPKEYLQDKELSIKAKGLLTIIYTLPDEWEYNMKGLSKISNLGEKPLRKLLHEIEENGYMRISRLRDKKGKFKYIYMIFIEKMPPEAFI